MESKKAHKNEGSAKEFLAFLQRQADNPEPILGRADLELQVKSWRSEWIARHLSPLERIEEVFDEPKRVAELAIEGGIQGRSTVLFDKGCGEFLDCRVRSIKLLNRLSRAGMGWVWVNRSAEEWARSLSRRIVRADGSIEPRG